MCSSSVLLPCQNWKILNLPQSACCATWTTSNLSQKNDHSFVAQLYIAVFYCEVCIFTQYKWKSFTGFLSNDCLYQHESSWSNSLTRWSSLYIDEKSVMLWSPVLEIWGVIDKIKRAASEYNAAYVSYAMSRKLIACGGIGGWPGQTKWTKWNRPKWRYM